MFSTLWRRFSTTIRDLTRRTDSGMNERAQRERHAFLCAILVTNVALVLGEKKFSSSEFSNSCFSNFETRDLFRDQPLRVEDSRAAIGQRALPIAVEYGAAIGQRALPIAVEYGAAIAIVTLRRSSEPGPLVSGHRIG